MSVPRRFPGWIIALAVFWTAGLGPAPAAVSLDPLGSFLTRHGYGGAQLVSSGQFFHLPIVSEGKPAHLVVDTGTPATLIFRSSVKRLQLSETLTHAPVSGAFGQGQEHYGVAIMRSFQAGNCTMENIPVAIAPDMTAMNVYGRPNGLLGLRELFKFGAVLDLAHHMVYLHPKPLPNELSGEMRTILQSNGWTPVPMTFTSRYLRVPGEANDKPCHLLVDTGAFVTALDRSFATAAKIPARPTRITAHGFGRTDSSVDLATFGSLWIGNYQIKQPSASLLALDSRMLARGTMSEVAGLLGVDYLAMNSAIIDFVSGTLYLRPGGRRGPTKGERGKL
jgi:predicted aspartyl protease